MEGTPQGPGSSFRANIIRVKTFWEIGLHLVSDPSITYGGNRDMTITIGSGAHENFQPSLRMATGSIILAHGVTNGDVDMAFVNPSMPHPGVQGHRILQPTLTRPHRSQLSLLGPFRRCGAPENRYHIPGRDQRAPDPRTHVHP